MPFDLDPNVQEGECEKIALAGKPYLVAPLLLRQVLIIRPLLPKALAAIKAPSEEWTEEQFLPVVQIVWRALMRAYVNLTFEELLDVPASTSDLIAAIPVIMVQMGAKAKGTSPEGEAPAAS